MSALTDHIRETHTDSHARSCDCGIPGLCILDDEDMPCSALRLADELERHAPIMTILTAPQTAVCDRCYPAVVMARHLDSEACGS